MRNRVVQPLTFEAPVVDGIVEEAWASAEVVADPMLFFETGGDPDKLGPMVEEMMANVVACLDLEKLRSTTMSEYLDAVDLKDWASPGREPSPSVPRARPLRSTR